jgi:hypothetical protein
MSSWHRTSSRQVGKKIGGRRCHPRLPRVFRIACRLAETGSFKNAGGFERDLVCLGCDEEMRSLAIPAIHDVLKGIVFSL